MSTVVTVLLEVLIVIGLSRLVGVGFRRIKQPLVIGEIVAGIMLGPSLFGWLAPSVAGTLFPPTSIPFLEVLSQVGLVFFMFLIGLELNPRYLQGQLETAVLTSHVSIVVPFSLGSLLALMLYPLVSNASVSFTAFALFLGSAMSITAFPVLARIITENNLQNSRLGTLALTCAAVDDVTAWCLLAGAIAVTRTNSLVGALPTILESVLYVTLMITAGRTFLKRLSTYYDRTGKLNQFLLAGIYMGVVSSALITELIGIHLIFGAFLIGAVMPKNEGLTREIAQKTEDFVLTFLLPIFFAYSGLRTQIGLLNRPELWLMCGLVLLVAIGGKYIGTYVAARVSGMESREASALGWLMNTRGLTELIVLNIGLSLGVISPLLFTMLVVMALVTTFMTSPLLELTYSKRLMRLDSVEPFPAAESLRSSPTYRILVPVANPNTQKGLLQLAGAIAGTQLQPAVIHPLSLIQLDEEYAFGSSPVEADLRIAQQRSRLETVIQTLEPAELRSMVHPIVRIASDVARETAQIAELDQADLILLGWHRPAFSSNRLGGRVGQILSTAKTDVAVYVDALADALNEQSPHRDSISPGRLLVPYVSDIHNDLGLELALRIMSSQPNCLLTVLHVTPIDQAGNDLSSDFRTLMTQIPEAMRDRITIPAIESSSPIEAVIEASAAVDLTIAGTSREWGIERQTLGRYTDELAVRCRSALLITRRYNRVTAHMAAMLTKPEPDEQRIPNSSLPSSSPIEE